MKDESRKDFSSLILPPSSFKIKTPLILGKPVFTPIAAWRTVRARNPRAHRYGAPLGMTIARMNSMCVNILNSTGAILPQVR